MARRARQTFVALAAATALAACGSDADDDLAPVDDPTTDAEVETGDDPTGDADSAADDADAAADDADSAADGGDESPGEIEVALEGTDGERFGTATLVGDDAGVWIEVDLLDVGDGAGFHGFHVHEEAVCDPDDAEGAFASAGGHLASGDDVHGDHAGDLPPLLVTEDGTANLTVRTDRFDLDQVLEGGGAALIIHADPDNLGHVPDRYTSDDADDGSGPDEETRDTGDAGDRLACGVIQATTEDDDTEDG